MSSRANILVALLILHAPYAAVGGEDSRVVRISVNYPRALAVAIDDMRRRHGVAISYEDPAYEYPGDIMDVTRWVRKDLDKYPDGQAPPVVFPRICRFETEYNVDVETGDPTNMLETLRAVVAAYNSGDNPGRFKVEELAIGLCVIPSEVRDAQGIWRPAKPLLDSLVSLSITNVTNFEALRSLISTIESNSPARVIVSAVMQNRDGISLSAENEQARSVLARLLRNSAYGGDHDFWQLNYGPQPPTYVLNLDRAVRGPLLDLGMPEWAETAGTSRLDRTEVTPSR